MAQHHARVGVPEAAGGEDELLLLDDEHLRACQACIERPADDRDPDVDAEEPRTHDRDHDDDEHDERERDDDVDGAHDDGLQPAAAVSREQPEADAEDERDVRRDQADHQVDARGVDRAGEDVAAQVVRAEQVSPGRRLQRVQQILVVRPARRDQRRGERAEDEEADDADADPEACRGPAALRARAPLERTQQLRLRVLAAGPDDAPAHRYRRILGSIRTITRTPKTRVSAEIVGKSRTEIVETSSEPSPGMLKTLSITTLPLIR